jgi:Ni,Fe-hydrogenase I small subunit
VETGKFIVTVGKCTAYTGAKCIFPGNSLSGEALKKPNSENQNNVPQIKDLTG